MSEELTNKARRRERMLKFLRNAGFAISGVQRGGNIDIPSRIV